MTFLTIFFDCSHVGLSWAIIQFNSFDLSASLRLGGEPRTSDSHVIIVGDAAGMIDPMTGLFVGS